MPKKIYTAVSPDGQTHKRTTADRTYTHTVVARWNYDEHLRRAGDASIHADNDKSNYNYYVRELDPATRKWTHSESELAGFTANIEGIANEADYLEAQIVKRIAKIEADKAAGEFDKYRNMGWCGRRDLAQKLLHDTIGKTGIHGGGNYYVDAVILDAALK